MIQSFLPRSTTRFHARWIVLAALSGSAVALAQSPNFQWVTTVSDQGTPLDARTDSRGRTVVAYGGILGWNGTTLRDYTGQCVLKQLDGDGVEVWSNTDLINVKSLAVGPDDVVYVAGTLMNWDWKPFASADYFAGMGVATEGTGVAYVAGVSSSGKTDWVRFLGTSSGVVPTDVAVNDLGESFVAGEYDNNHGTTILADQPLPTPDGSSGQNLFIVKYSREGKALWVRVGERTADSASSTLPRVVLDASGNVILSFGKTFLFEGRTVTGRGIAKYSAEGRFLGTLHAEIPVGSNDTLAVDRSGNIFHAGNADSAVTGQSGFFLRKYGPEGELLWGVEPQGKNGWGWDPMLAVNPAGECVLVGTFGASSPGGRIVPGEITLGATKLSTDSLLDVFVAKFGDAGEVRWAIQTHGEEPLWIGDAPPRWSDTRVGGYGTGYATGVVCAGPDGDLRLVLKSKGTVRFGDVTVVGGNSTEPLALLTARIHDPIPPTVRLALRKEGGVIRLSWPTSATGFLLESADALPASAWTPVGTTPAVEAGQYVVALEAGGGARFFRLRTP